MKLIWILKLGEIRKKTKYVVSWHGHFVQFSLSRQTECVLMRIACTKIEALVLRLIHAVIMCHLSLFLSRSFGDEMTKKQKYDNETRDKCTLEPAKCSSSYTATLPVWFISRQKKKTDVVSSLYKYVLYMNIVWKL